MHLLSRYFITSTSYVLEAFLSRFTRHNGVEFLNSKHLPTAIGCRNGNIHMYSHFLNSVHSGAKGVDEIQRSPKETAALSFNTQHHRFSLRSLHMIVR